MLKQTSSPSSLRSTLMLLAVLAVGACDKSSSGSSGSSDDNYDAKDLQGGIVGALAAGGMAVTATCPANIPLSQTTPFDCTATPTGGGDPIKVTVTPKGNGNVHFDFANVIDQSKVTEPLEAKFKDKLNAKEVDIKCPKKFAVVKAGDTFTCPATVDGTDKSMECTVTDPASGNVDCNVK